MTTGFKETKIGPIPEDWEVKQLDEFGEFHKGKTINSSDIRETGLPCIRYGDIYVQYKDANIVTHFSAFIDEDTAKNGQRIYYGDILFAGTGETAEDIGKCVAYTLGMEAYAGGDLVIFRPKDTNKCNSVFLSCCLNNGNVAKWKSRLGQGLSIFHIYSKDLKTLYVPVPVYNEQRKIAEILSTVDETIEKTDTIIQETQQLKKGLMQKLFAKGIGHTRFKETEIGRISLGTIPVEWNEVELSSLCNVTSSKRIMMYEYVDSGVPFYRSKEIIEKMSGISHARTLYIPESRFQKISRQFGVPNKGDILVTAVGSLGIPYLIEDDESFYFKDGNLLWLRDISADINKKFLIYYFLSFGFNKVIEVITGGSSQKALTIEKLEKVKIPLPNSSEQYTITEILSEVDAKIETEEAFKAELEQLKRGLMQVLLTGKVRVKV